MEDLRGVPDHSVDIAGQDDLAVSLGEVLPEPLHVLDELLPLPLHLASADHVAQDHVCEQPPHVALVGRVELVLEVFIT